MSHSHCRLVALGLFTVAAAGFVGCQQGQKPPPAMPPARVTVAHAVMFSVQPHYEYNGYLEAIETAQIRARVQGFLTRVEFTEGDEVPADKLLYTIDEREYVAGVKKAKADKLKAEAELKRAEAEEARAKKAYEQGGTSIEEYQQKTANRQTAAAVVEQTQAMMDAAELTLSYTKVTAPIAGRISRTLVTKGNLVGQGEATLLTTIVSMDPLYVYFDIPERDLVEYQRALATQGLPDPTSQEIPVEVGVATEEGYPHRGHIDFRENRVETATGTVRIRGRIPNPSLLPDYIHKLWPALPAAVGVAPAHVPAARLLYPGLYARVRVPSGGPVPRPVIPEEALMTGQEGRYVYVVGPGNKVLKRTVTVGPQVYRAPPPGDPRPIAWQLVNPNPQPVPPEQLKGAPPPPSQVPVRSVVAIEKGLTPDDVVIVNGLQKARPGSEVAPEPWEFRGPASK